MKILWISLLCVLSGCTIGNGHICGPQTPAAYCDKDTYEKLMHPKPYGAHWVKEGMTREIRQIDFVQCGGSPDLREDYKEWLSSIPYEVYASEKTLHIRKLAACMQAKSYVWLDACDARCLHP